MLAQKKKVRFNLPIIEEEIVSDTYFNFNALEDKEEKMAESPRCQFFYYHKHERTFEIGYVSISALEDTINQQLKEGYLQINLIEIFDVCLEEGERGVAQKLKSMCVHKFNKTHREIKILYSFVAIITSTFFAYFNITSEDETLTKKILYTCVESLLIGLFMAGLHYCDKKITLNKIHEVFARHEREIMAAFLQYQNQLDEEKILNSLA
ncbi:MAG: hypothetical protein SFW66_06320 [Gammaproteobacteria bacterium]|nr:hypothetical protein [Gammaproteobacteria bacterium]